MEYGSMKTTLIGQNELAKFCLFYCVIFYLSLVGEVTWTAILVTSTPTHLVSIRDQMTH